VQTPCYTTIKKMTALQGEIEKGVRILKKGGVIAFPTDTVYGLGADAFNSGAVERIYEIKNRPKQQHFPLLIADTSQLTAMADPIPGIAWFLAERFWPGGLTLVLPKANPLPAYLAPGHSIALRVPNHPICLSLIQRLGNPVTGTSANISGQAPALTADEVEQQLGEKIDFIINGGKCPGSKESTVVDITHEPPVILRQGIIPAYEIDKAYKEYSEVNSEARCYRL
jgi:L-threonylcarbamoyladenylate synthase